MAFRSPFIPTPVDQADLLEIIRNGRSVTMRGVDVSNRAVGTTSSFFYDPPQLGIKSTQQLNVDWSKFENHTFFNSAEVKTNVAFDRIINFFPFDGTRNEVEVYFEKMTGFEKYVYDRFPKNKGYLFFNNSYIIVRDYTGGALPEISKTKTGKSVLSPEDSFTLEFHLYLPTVTNGAQVIAQKVSGTDGMTAFVAQSSATTNAFVGLSFASGSTVAAVSASFDKGIFNHGVFVYNKEDGTNSLSLYKNGILAGKSVFSDVGDVAMDFAPMTIGTGSQYRTATGVVTPTQILSGALDEFRFFHSARTIEQITESAKKGIFSTDDLKLYYKFNEPTGTIGTTSSDSINSIVLDSSGRALHSYVTNFSHDLRSTGSFAVPMTNEKTSLCPVLFPNFAEVVDLNEELLLSASAFDLVNPNTITRLIPSHYLLQGKTEAGFESDSGPIVDSYEGTDAPGTGKLGQTQLLLSLLYTWSKFFDEMKLYIDALARSEDVDYDPNVTAADHFLPLLFKKWGIKIPAFFVDASIEQFVDAENLKPVISTDTNSLQYIQNQILRRVLTNLNDVIRSKGTQHSIRSFLRSMGFDPDNTFRIKEYGGPTRRSLTFARESKSEIGKMLDFLSGGFVKSGFLSGSRTEVGFPAIRAGSSYVQKETFYPHGISNSVHDGLWTSGSWTYEAFYRWPKDRAPYLTQSLARLHTTGTLTTGTPGLVFNLVAVSGTANEDPRIVLYGRTTAETSFGSAPVLKMFLTGTNIFDGELWNVCFGMQRSDEAASLSASYYLRAGRQMGGELQPFVTQSFYREVTQSGSADASVLVSITGSFNASGSFIAIGSGSIPTSATGGMLNNTSVESEAIATNFNGQTSGIRFWSKSVPENEWKEHARNPKSVGVSDPLTNFGFTNTVTGSFGRLRLDASADQQNRTSAADGTISLIDFSQNGKTLEGSNFAASKQVINPVIWNYTYISPNFDDGVTNEKVRVRGYQSYDRVLETPWAQVAPVHQIDPSERPMDDPRFSIEFSLIDSLNRDIVNIFSVLDSLDDALGQPNLLFSTDYPDLENLRAVYFNRLTEKINLNRFFDMYRWFDASISSFIESTIPRKTRFLGTNFVVESHMLERNRKEYFHSDMYAATNDRHNINNVLLLQLIAGTLKKY